MYRTAPRHLTAGWQVSSLCTTTTLIIGGNMFLTAPQAEERWVCSCSAKHGILTYDFLFTLRYNLCIWLDLLHENTSTIQAYVIVPLNFDFSYINIRLRIVNKIFAMFTISARINNLRKLKPWNLFSEGNKPKNLKAFRPWN